MVSPHSEVRAHARCYGSITSVMPSINLQQLLLTFRKLAQHFWKESHENMIRFHVLTRFKLAISHLPCAPLLLIHQSVLFT